MGDHVMNQSSRDERANARSGASSSSALGIISPPLATDQAEDPRQEEDQAMISSLIRDELASYNSMLRQDLVILVRDMISDMTGNMQTPDQGRQASSPMDIREMQDSGNAAPSASSASSASPASHSRLYPSFGNYSSSVRYANPMDPDHASEHDQVSLKSYTKTTDEIIKTVRGIRITGTSTDVNRKIECFKHNLDMANLLTLIDGRRLCPVQTNTNPNGYSPRTVGTFNDPMSIRNADDFFLYQYDMKRLFQLVSAFFCETLYYHCTEDITNGNGIEMYNKIISKVNGKALRDIDAAQSSLDNFKINPGKSIPSELSRLDDVILKLEHAQQNPVADITKKNILSKLILKDPRTILHTHVTFAHLAGYTYQVFRDGFCLIYDNLPASYQLVKMAAMNNTPETPSPKPKGICYKHQKGLCTLGTKCKYSHDLPNPTPTPIAPPGVMKPNRRAGNNPNRNPKFDYSNVKLNERLKREIGAPSGIPAVNNQRGYSRNQMAKIKILLDYTNSPAGISDTPTQWGEPEEFLNSLKMTGVTYPPEDQSLSEDGTSTPPTDAITDTTVVCHHTPPILESPPCKIFRRDATPYRMSHVDNLQEVIHKMNDMDTRINNMIPDRFTGYQSNQRYVIYVSHSINSFHPNMNGDKIPSPMVYLHLFGWQTNNILAQAFRNEHDMSHPSLNDMRLIHHLGALMFNAIIIPRCELQSSASSVTQSSTSMYNTHNPIHEPVYCGTKEVYVTAFQSMSEYQSEIISVENNSVLTIEAKNFLMYVIIYDFMSYVSKMLSGMPERDVNNYPSRSLRNTRMNLQAELFRYGDENTPMYEAFRAIILHIRPTDTVFQEPSVPMILDPIPADMLYEYQSTYVYGTPESVSHRQSHTPQSYNTPTMRMTRLYNNISDPIIPIMEPLDQMSVLIQQKIGKIATIKSPAQILDTGATVCGAGRSTGLDNIQHCNGVNVQGAFGKAFQPKEKGTILAMELECLVIPGMTDTLISVSAACKKGHTFIFDVNGCHGYKTDSIRSIVTDMKENGQEVIRGELRGGLYHMIPIPEKIMNISPTPILPPSSVSVPSTRVQEVVLYTNATPASKFEHVHCALGHPGVAGMEWHRKNTPGADYTTEDANKPRGLCKGCVEGGMRQASTDHRRQHRPPPTGPGVQFSVDAFTCSVKSRNGHSYCDIFTDLHSRRRYPVFTSNRTAVELCAKASILFDLHPEWKYPPADRSMVFDIDGDSEPPDSRFIRLDAESNYKSTEFLHWAAERGFRLERVAPRDKHANGIAERSVGVLTLTTNVIMLTPTPPVPILFWDLAMEYAADTLSFCYTKAIGTSPYVLLTKSPVPFKILQPFWTSCYVYFGQKN